MRLLKIFGKTIAAAAIALPTIVNASSTSTVDLEISDFQINFSGPVIICPEDLSPCGVAPPAGVAVIDVSTVAYAGTNATAELNGVFDSETSIIAPFDLVGTIGTPAVDGAFANASLDGELFTGLPVTGITNTQASKTGNGEASADAQIVNSFDAGIRFDMRSDVSLFNNTVSFDWLLDVFMSVFDQGGTANYTYLFDFAITEKGSINAPFEYALTGADTNVAVSGSLNDFGTASTGGPVAGNQVSGFFDLIAGTEYTVTINQATSAAVTSIPAPGTMALFGGSILAIALIRRRKIK